MNLTMALRLLGFLPSDACGALDIARARRACIREVGLADAATDVELLERATAILREMGLVLQTTSGSDGAANVMLAGTLTREGQVEGLLVEVRGTGLRGERGEVIGNTSTTPHGQFAVRFSTGDARLLVVLIRDGDRELHRFAAIRSEPEIWLEWSESGEPARPVGRFEVREALLASILTPEGIKLGELADRDDREPVMNGLTSLSGLPAEVVKHHIIAARLGRGDDLDLPAAIVASLLGQCVQPGRRRLPLDEDFAPEIDALPDATVTSSSLTGDEIDAARESIVAQTAAGVSAAMKYAVADGELSTRYARAAAKVEQRLRSRVTPPVDRAVGERGATWRHLLRFAGIPEELVDSAGEHFQADRHGPVRRPVLERCPDPDLDLRQHEYQPELRPRAALIFGLLDQGVGDVRSTRVYEMNLNP